MDAIMDAIIMKQIEKYGKASIYPTGRINKKGEEIYGIAFYYDDIKLSILSELAKLLKISVTDGYKGMGFQQITQQRTLSYGGVLCSCLFPAC